MASPGKSAAVKAPEPPAELVREPLVLNNRSLLDYKRHRRRL